MLPVANGNYACSLHSGSRLVFFELRVFIFAFSYLMSSLEDS